MLRIIFESLDRWVGRPRKASILTVLEVMYATKDATGNRTFFVTEVCDSLGAY
jgi:hypothetical protein